MSKQTVYVSFTSAHSLPPRIILLQNVNNFPWKLQQHFCIIHTYNVSSEIDLRRQLQILHKGDVIRDIKSYKTSNSLQDHYLHTLLAPLQWLSF